MMKHKITLLTLLLTICFPVYAKDSYTDYTFIGYTNEKSENTELYKFEPIKLHNFYRYTEIGTKYLEDTMSIDGDQVDLNDIKEENTISHFKPKEDIPFTTHILIKGQDNYITKKIILKNAKSLLDSGAKFKIYYGNRVQTETADVVADSNDLTFALGRNCAVDGLKLEIDYKIEKPITITYNPVNISSNLTIDQEFTLDPKISYISLTSKIYYNYEKFLEENNLVGVGEDYVTYYEYSKKLYRHFYYVKDDFIKSFEKTIDGYQYDPLEDETVYAVYRREKIIPNVEEKKNEEKNQDRIEESVIPVNGVEKENITKPIKKTVYTAKQKIKKNTDSATLEPESNSNVLPVSQPESPLESEREEPSKIEEDAECEENKRPLVLKWIGISMLSVSAVSLIIHFICVKFRDEND